MKTIPLFDAHADTLFLCDKRGGELRRNNLHIDLERGMKYRPYAQFFAIWGKPEQPRGDLYSEYNRLMARMEAEIEKNADILVLCRSADDAEDAATSGKIAAFISVEGAELLDCSTEKLERAFDSGVRAVNLCWNYANDLCGSCAQESGRGLSGAGRAFVRRAQELGVIIDLSHASEQAFWDTAEIATKPLMASHSNSKAVHNHPRNLTDEQFAALVKNGGVSGINLYSEFLSSGRTDTGDVIAHIEHFLSLGGERSVVLGSDFDGMDAPPEGISGIEDMEKLYESLLMRNYSEDLVRDIFYNNLMRLLRAQ